MTAAEWHHCEQCAQKGNGSEGGQAARGWRRCRLGQTREGAVESRWLVELRSRRCSKAEHSEERPPLLLVCACSVLILRALFSQIPKQPTISRQVSANRCTAHRSDGYYRERSPLVGCTPSAAALSALPAATLPRVCSCLPLPIRAASSSILLHRVALVSHIANASRRSLHDPNPKRARQRLSLSVPPARASLTCESQRARGSRNRRVCAAVRSFARGRGGAAYAEQSNRRSLFHCRL